MEQGQENSEDILHFTNLSEIAFNNSGPSPTSFLQLADHNSQLFLYTFVVFIYPE